MKLSPAIKNPVPFTYLPQMALESPQIEINLCTKSHAFIHLSLI